MDHNMTFFAQQIVLNINIYDENKIKFELSIVTPVLHIKVSLVSGGRSDINLLPKLFEYVCRWHLVPVKVPTKQFFECIIHPENLFLDQYRMLLLITV